MFKKYKEKKFIKELSAYANEKLDIIVVAGQSNAEGCGRGYEEMKYRQNPLILSLDKKKGLKIANENNIGRVYRSWFGLTFGEEYIKQGLLKKDRKLLLLNVAVGGTGFSDNRWGLTEDLYLNMINRVNTFQKLNVENSVKCILWHQGESDALNNMSEEKYYEKLTTLIVNARKQIDLLKLPFIAGDMVPEWKVTEPMSFVIERATRRVVKDTPDCYYVESSELEGNSKPDIIHFNRKSNIELGKRYFESFYKHQSSL